jgi:Tol biopolymer transport system component
VRAAALLSASTCAALLATSIAFASSGGTNGSLLISLTANRADPALYALDRRRGLRLLVPGSGRFSGTGAYSPGGTAVAFARFDATHTKLGLWSVGPTGRSLRKLVAAVPSPVFAWDPDGKHLAFYAPASNEIVLVDLEGRQVAVLGRRIHAESIDWSPDGRTIYFEGWESGSAPVACRPGVCALDAGTHALRQVVVDDQRDTSWAHYWITVAPDSKHIAFVRNCFSGSCQQLQDGDGLIVANANGSHARVLVRGAIGSPVWAPDGSSIAFVDQFTGTGAPANVVRVAAVATGASTPVRAFAAPAGTESPPHVELLSWQSR